MSTPSASASTTSASTTSASTTSEPTARRRIPPLAVLVVAPVAIALLVLEPGGGPAAATAQDRGSPAAVPVVPAVRTTGTGTPAIAPPPGAVAVAADDAVVAGAAPSIRVLTGPIELGRVAHRTVVERTIAFRNEGDAPLNVLAVRTSCSCTSAEADRRIVAAGDEAIVRVTFEGRTLGRQERLVRIVTDDPRTPIVTIPVRAEVG